MKSQTTPIRDLFGHHIRAARATYEDPRRVTDEAVMTFVNELHRLAAGVPGFERAVVRRLAELEDDEPRKPTKLEIVE